MDESAELTKDNRTCTLTMAFNYGGRAEIVDAVRALVAEGVKAEKVDEKAIRRHLYHPDMPDPDLVVRTSGEHRISNYLLWEIAYSELVFPDVLWPDFRREPPLRGGARVPAPRAALRGPRAVTWTRVGIVGGVLLLALVIFVVALGSTALRAPLLAWRRPGRCSSPEGTGSTTGWASSARPQEFNRPDRRPKEPDEQ